MASTGLIRILLEDRSGPARPASAPSSNSPTGPAQPAPPGPRPYDRSLFGPPNVPSPNVPKIAPTTIRAEGPKLEPKEFDLFDFSNEAMRSGPHEPISKRSRAPHGDRAAADPVPRPIPRPEPSMSLAEVATAKEPFGYAHAVREHMEAAATSAKNIESSFARIKAPEPKGSSNTKAPQLDSTASQPRPQGPRTAAHPEPAGSSTYGFKEAKDRLQAGPTYEVKPAEATPKVAKTPLPRAQPVGPSSPAGPRPVAQPFGTEAIKNAIPNKVAAGMEAVGMDVGGMAASVAKAGPALGELAAVAGPAAVALIAVELATQAVVAGFGKLQRGIESAGHAAADIAGSNGAGALNTAFDGLTGAMDNAGPVLRIWSAELKAAVAPIRAISEVSTAFAKRGRETLAVFSGAIAGANAKADVRQTLGDVKESQRLGQDIARITDAQSRSENAAREIALPVRQVLAKISASIEERAANILERIVPLMEVVARAAEFWYNHGPKQAIEAAEEMERRLKMIYDALMQQLGIAKKKEVEDAINPLLAEFRNIVQQQRTNPNKPAPNQAGESRNQRIGLPIFGK